MSEWLKKEKAAYIRNFIFGVEDSLVSTVGLVSGIAAAGVDRSTLFVTGMILIVVEALSMGVGSLLAESSAEEFTDKRKTSLRLPITGALIMFVSYFVAGFIPLLPYAVLETSRALPLSIIVSLIALFLLGYVSAAMFNAPRTRSAWRMIILGGLAIAAGSLIGRFFHLSPL